MTIAYAVKALERKGWKIGQPDGRRYVANKPGSCAEISFLPNGQDLPGQDAVCLRVRRISDLDDIQTDYCAGSFVDSIPQALRMAGRIEQN